MKTPNAPLSFEGKISPQQAMGMPPEVAESMYGQAYRLYTTGKYQEAAQLFRLLVMLNPTEGKYVFGLAACTHLMKEYLNAIELYTICGGLDPLSPLPSYHLSDCYIHIGDKLSALVALKIAVKRAEENPKYHQIKERALLSIETLTQELQKEQILEKK